MADCADKFNIFEKSYWQYYRELESELISTKKYVSFDIVNKNTFSVEYLKLLQSVCSEIDVVGKAIANELNEKFDPTQKNNTIQKWWLIIQEWFNKECGNPEVLFFDSFKLEPWKGYSVEEFENTKGAKRIKLKNGCKTPFWWTAYNKVKHNRTSIDSDTESPNYVKANLWNVSNAYAALYLLEKTFLVYSGTSREIDALDTSLLFETEQKLVRISDEEMNTLFNKLF